MTKLEQLEQEIMGLSPSEQATLSEWMQNHLADAWDQQIEKDATAGKFDRLAKEALAEHRAGKTKAL